ncbi:hypothetical protein B0H11DRAFT_1899809 [Mycena galericulata]|nr:hypothetical protein B0H11DRAFT_1899809 [Mycena galericulata]
MKFARVGDVESQAAQGRHAHACGPGAMSAAARMSNAVTELRKPNANAPAPTFVQGRLARLALFDPVNKFCADGMFRPARAKIQASARTQNFLQSPPQKNSLDEQRFETRFRISMTGTVNGRPSRLV